MATPSYFSGETASNMDGFLKDRRQQVTRQAFRGATALGTGLNHGAPAAQKWLDEHPATNFDKNRARFAEDVAMSQESQKTRAGIDENVRNDVRMRWLKEMDAAIQEMTQLAETSRHNATLAQNMTFAKMEARNAALLREEKKRQEGSAHFNDVMGQLDGDMEALKTRLRETLGDGVGGAGGAEAMTPVLDADGQPLGNASWKALALTYKSNPDESIVSLQAPGGKAIFADEMESTSRAAKIDNIFRARQFAALNPGYSDAEYAAALNDQYGTELTDAEVSEYRGYTVGINVKEKDLSMSMRAGLGLQSDAEMAAASRQRSRAKKEGEFMTERLDDFLAMDDDALDAQQAANVINSDQRREIDATRAGMKDRMYSAIRNVAIGSMESPEQVMAERLRIANEVGMALGMSAKEVWDESAAATGSNWGGDYNTAVRAVRADQDARDSELALESGQMADYVAETHAGGVNNAGVQTVQEDQRKWRESGESTPVDSRVAADYNAETEAGIEDIEGTVSGIGNAVADTSTRLTAEQEKAKQEAEKAKSMAQNGQVEWNGLLMDADSIPAETGGQVDLLLRMIDEQPDYPPMQQAKRDMMASPEFAKWQEERGFVGEPNDWMFRQFTREYKYVKRQNLTKNREIAALNKRAGITDAREEGELGGHGADIKTAGSRAATRANFRGRVASDRDANKRERDERKAAKTPETVTTGARNSPEVDAVIAEHGSPAKPGIADRIRSRRKG